MNGAHVTKVFAASLGLFTLLIAGSVLSQVLQPQPLPLTHAPDQSELAQAIGAYLDGNSPAASPAASVRLAATETPAAAAQPEAKTYIGQRVCAACHQLENENWAHTIHASVFTLNPRNALEERGCEACHGPGSVHIRNPAVKASIVRFTHDGGTPVAAQNAQCQACHRGGQRIHWSGSAHERQDVACSDCHGPHANFSARGLTVRQSTTETCLTCHATQRAEFRRRSHKPVLEGQVTCTDCHNPHGSTTEPLLKASSVSETCYGCHAEKRGPFLFEHAPVRDSCLNCHAPHGSNHEKLLATPGPLLCQQCHTQPGHDTLLMTRGNMALGPAPDIRLLGRNCAACHSQVHGSNSPSGFRLQR
jgi:DmsE family decaheme c-type cytochrome